MTICLASKKYSLIQETVSPRLSQSRLQLLSRLLPLVLVPVAKLAVVVDVEVAMLAQPEKLRRNSTLRWLIILRLVPMPLPPPPLLLTAMLPWMMRSWYVMVTISIVRFTNQHVVRF